MVICFVLISILALIVLVSLRKIAKLNDYVDSLYNQNFITDTNVMDHDERLRAHFNDMANLSMKLDALDRKLSESDASEKGNDAQEVFSGVIDDVLESNQATIELNERREKFVKYRKQGMDVKSAGVAVGVSYSTAKRYNKWMTNNKK